MVKEIVGRKHERKTLNKLLESSKSEFLAIYGRRRIGKTFLIKETYKEHIIFKCSGINTSSLEDQLELFYESLLQAGLPATSAPTTWIEAFRALKVLINDSKVKKKKVIFIDEISWLDTPRSKFIPSLSHFWNTYCTDRNDIILVACGSVSTWITDNILNDRGELHNRSTKNIRLLPFSLYETEAYLKSKRVYLSKKDVTNLYMIIGGIPYYLDAVESGRSIPQIMDDLFYNDTASLKNEYNNLYPALFKNPEMHMKIIEALSKKNAGMTRQEITDRAKIKSGGTMTKVLTELESCGFIKVINAFDKKKEDKTYRLIDEFSIFYHKYIHLGNVTSGLALGNTRSFNIWCGFAFENLCIKHSKHIAFALGISGTDWSVYSFKDNSIPDAKGSQIDLIIDRSDAINIIEAKFYNDVYNLNLTEANNIRHRVSSFLEKTKSKKSIFKTLITPFGAVKNEHYLSEITNDLTVENLFVDIVF